jgi:hypothetical protein
MREPGVTCGVISTEYELSFSSPNTVFPLMSCSFSMLRWELFVAFGMHYLGVPGVAGVE